MSLVFQTGANLLISNKDFEFLKISNHSNNLLMLHIVRNVEFSPTNWTLPVRLLFASNQIT